MSPLTVAPIVPVAVTSLGSITATAEPNVIRLAGPDTSIKAAAAQMVFANRSSRDFATPSEVKELEKWTGQVTCSTLIERFQNGFFLCLLGRIRCISKATGAS